MINKLLANYLKGKAVYLDGKISSNSFKANLGTAIARASCDEAVIKQMGMWKSEAHLLYCKRGRVTNLQAQGIMKLYRKVIIWERG